MFPSSSSSSSSSSENVQNNETTAEEVKWQRDIIEIRSNLLEKILTRRLIVEGGLSEDDDDDELEEQGQQQEQEQTSSSELKAVQYMIRYDSHWLKCYQPNFPLMTILGLIEDDHSQQNNEQDGNYSLFDDFILQCHIISSTSSCPVGGVVVKENNNNNNNNGNSSDNMINQVTTASSSSSSPPKIKKLQWIDLRLQHRKQQQHNENNNDSSSSCNNNNSLLSSLMKWNTPGDCYTLLQSILGYDHDSSPWNNCINDETNNSKDSNNNRSSLSSTLQQPKYDICILVLPFNNSNNNDNDDTDDYGNRNDVGTNAKTNNALKEFRVSDASPSWFLHSIVNCDYMEYNGNCLTTTTTTTMENKNGYYYYNNNTTNANSNSTSSSSSEGGAPATLFIYKRLPLRPGFINDININNNNENNKDDVEDDDDVVVVEENLPTDLSLATNLGCLWEIVAVSTDDGNDGDGDDGNDGYQRSSQPNNNNMNGNKEEKTEQRQQLLRRRLQCPPYLDLSKVYNPSIYQQLFSSKAIETFMNEAMKIPQWTPWPETHHYSSSNNNNGDGGDHHATWTVFPLCYCFPANDVSKRTWVDATTAYCPKTCQILLQVLGPLLRTALFSQLSPNTILAAHTGWMDLANHVLRLHIPLIVPSRCGTWVDGVIKLHEKGKPILFDDSKIHRAFNYSNKSRIVLIVDIERPNTSLPIGYATGGHSDELDSFIQKMSMPK